MNARIKNLLVKVFVFSIILLVGIVFYARSFSNYNVRAHTTTGISASQNYYDSGTMNVLDFSMTINVQNNTIALAFSFDYDLKGNYTFSFTLPYRISDLKISVGNWSYQNAESGSIVVVNYNVNENPTGWNYTRVSALLFATDSVADTFFETRSISLPFGGSLTDDVWFAREQLLAKSPLTMVGGGFNGSVLILIPSNSIITTTTVPVARVDTYEGQQVLEFRISGFSPFQMQYIDPDRRRDFEVNLLFSGILFGAAVSGFAGTFIETFTAKKQNGDGTNSEGKVSQDSTERNEMSDERSCSANSNTETKDEEKILEMIRRIDNNKSLFKWYDILKAFPTSLASIMVIAIASILVVNFENVNDLERVILMVSVVTLFVAFFAFIAQLGEEIIVDVNYNRIRNCFADDEKPLAKALVKLKSENSEFKLEQIYNIHKPIFTKERLLEKLYESSKQHT